jgi:hypothetical protein
MAIVTMALKETAKTIGKAITTSTSIITARSTSTSRSTSSSTAMAKAKEKARARGKFVVISTVLTTATTALKTR